MRIRWNGNEYDSPPLGNGALAGFTLGELKWAKKKIGVRSLDDLNQIEVIVLYGVLSIRRADHTVLPLEQFWDLSAGDFSLVEHALGKLDRDGDCLECGSPPDSSLHVGDPTMSRDGEEGATRTS